jgi:hypothetical protein
MSPLFEKNIQTIFTRTSERLFVETIPVPILRYSWLGKHHTSHQYDHSRAELNFVHCVQSDFQYDPKKILKWNKFVYWYDWLIDWFGFGFKFGFDWTVEVYAVNNEIGMKSFKCVEVYLKTPFKSGTPLSFYSIFSRHFSLCRTFLLSRCLMFVE